MNCAAPGEELQDRHYARGCVGAGKLDVALKYAVPGASWAPSYDARLQATERAVELGYFGLVRNGTGEDWSEIALTLSTARPGLGGGAPELSPWIVDVAQPRVTDEETIKLSPFVVTSENSRQAERSLFGRPRATPAPAAEKDARSSPPRSRPA